MIDLSKYADIVAAMYSDFFTIYRYHNETDEDGGTRSVRDEHPTYQDVACLISPRNDDSATPMPRGALRPNQSVSFHCHPNHVILCGDYVVLRKFSGGTELRRYSGTVGEPKVYPTHTKATLELDASGDRGGE